MRLLEKFGRLQYGPLSRRSGKPQQRLGDQRSRGPTSRHPTTRMPLPSLGGHRRHGTGTNTSVSLRPASVPNSTSSRSHRPCSATSPTPDPRATDSVRSGKVDDPTPRRERFRRSEAYAGGAGGTRTRSRPRSSAEERQPNLTVRVVPVRVDQAHRLPRPQFQAASQYRQRGVRGHDRREDVVAAVAGAAVAVLPAVVRGEEGVEGGEQVVVAAGTRFDQGDMRLSRGVRRR